MFYHWRYNGACRFINYCIIECMNILWNPIIHAFISRLMDNSTKSHHHRRKYTKIQLTTYGNTHTHTTLVYGGHLYISLGDATCVCVCACQTVPRPTVGMKTPFAISFVGIFAKADAAVRRDTDSIILCLICICCHKGRSVKACRMKIWCNIFSAQAGICMDGWQSAAHCY